MGWWEAAAPPSIRPSRRRPLLLRQTRRQSQYSQRHLVLDIFSNNSPSGSITWCFGAVVLNRGSMPEQRHGTVNTRWIAV